MHLLPYPVIILGYILTTVTSEPSSSYSSQNYHHRPDTAASTFLGIGPDSDVSSSLDNNIDKRTERYAFGLGRRAYTYTSGGGQGVKRLPVYNFGLGKRARPYAFGLGKRANDEEYAEADFAYDVYPLAEKEDRNNIDASEKRARPYSFGLGKRQGYSDDGLERRASPQRYNFGLGKR